MEQLQWSRVFADAETRRPHLRRRSQPEAEVIRYLLAFVLLVLAGTAFADTEYTGGSVTAVNGERYYLTGDVSVTDGQTITVGSGVSIEFDGGGYAITNGSGTGADWDWMSITSGGYAYVHDLAEIEEGLASLDTDGHYSRPDVFELSVDTRAKEGTVWSWDS